MKAFRILTAAVPLGVILIFSGCGGKNNPAESTQDKQLGLLSKTWKISTVTKDGVDQKTSWTGFQLTISGTKGNPPFSYTCASRATFGPWPASGTWAFGTDPVTQIIRDPGGSDVIPVTYTATATTLQVTFNYAGTGYAGPRLSSTSGNWIFNFTN